MAALPRFLWSLCLLVIGLHYALASSPPPRPLKRVVHPTTHAFEILPRRPAASGVYAKRSLPLSSPILEHTDTFRITLSAFDETFYLHLRPNEHLVHPAARITYHTTGADGKKTTHTTPLLPETVRAYWGEVVRPDVSNDRMREDAAGVRPRPTGDRSEMGWARITVHDQGDIASGAPPSFEGAFSVNGIVHHVMTADSYLRSKHVHDPYIEVGSHPDSNLVIFRDTDVMTVQEFTGRPSPPQTCAHDGMDFNTNPLMNPALRRPIMPQPPWYDPFGLLNPLGHGNASSYMKRDDAVGSGMGTNFEDSIGSTMGCPTTQKVIYLGVAADCVYTSTYGSQQNATQHIITSFNTASALYKSTFNVSLGIINLDVHDPTCPTSADPATPWNVACQDDVTLNDRLSLFSDWRGKKGNDGAGLWHLMSGCPTGSEVGIAWLATLCQQTSSGEAGSVVSGTAVSTAGRVEWQVIAHEIGHNFGAIHDCASGCTTGTNNPVCCPLSKDSCNADSKFIMSPVADQGETKFSPCSLGNICSLMQGNSGGMTNTTCLIDASAARQTIGLGMCGNGIVEQDEECDPGQGVESSCCDASTCKLKGSAKCDPSNSACCTSQCQFAASSQVCRPAKDASCDQAEMCTGSSADCPEDLTSPNGQSCGSDGLACASGVCTSLSKQCQTVGASMGLTQACPQRNDKSCQVSCQDPKASNQCIVLQSTLVDGSPCGYGGTCEAGQCKSGSVFDTAKAWYVQNLQISIPVTVVAGIVVLLILWAVVSALVRCCRRDSSSYKGTIDPAFRGRRGQRLDSWPNMAQIPPTGPAGAIVPPPYSHNRGRSHGSWGTPVPAPPPGPPPAHRLTRSSGSNSHPARLSS